MKMEMMKEATRLVRIFLNQKSWGVITLHVIMLQYAHQYGPVARLMNAYASYSTQLYHAIKNSVMYATPTIEPVRIMILFISSMCCMVMYSSSDNTFLATSMSVSTIANPEKIAPATRHA